jgi:rRNA processing protein Gar1
LLLIIVSITSWTELGILRINIIGITLISILSGFGVVDTPFTAWSSHKRHVSERDFIVAERAYQQTVKMIEEKRSLLEKTQKQHEEPDKKKEKVYSFIWQ